MHATHKPDPTKRKGLELWALGKNSCVRGTVPVTLSEGCWMPDRRLWGLDILPAEYLFD